MKLAVGKRVAVVEKWGRWGFGCRFWVVGWVEGGICGATTEGNFAVANLGALLRGLWVKVLLPPEQLPTRSRSIWRRSLSRSKQNL